MYKLGSLFDGSGGFPLAGALCGVEPVWASEVEPYPIAVTRERFPSMKHLGDISKINGAEVEPVDIITFGSPCQDLSVAGKRAGLKHEANGDEETTRSGLFMEAVRIIKEMREATNGKYPRFALWENVPGAFSSNKGEDFRVVCEELIKIIEPEAFMPPVPKNGWPYADSYVGDKWSLAYRVFDAQYWGVPQRRRRIHLIVDFRGERAREVLFEREGVRGYFAEGGKAWQRTPGNVEGSAGATDREGECEGVRAIGFDSYNLCETGDIGRTVCTPSGGLNEHIPCIYYPEAVGINGEIAGTLDASYFKGCGMRQGVEREEVAEPIAFDAYQHHGWRTSGVIGTLTAGQNDSIRGDTPLVCIPYTLKIRSVCEGGGKGAPIQKDMSATLATNNDQYLFQPIEEPQPIPIHDQATRFLGKRGEKADGKGNGLGVGEPGAPMNTLTSADRHAVAYCIGNGQAAGLYLQENVGTLDCMHDQKCVLYWDGSQTVGTLTANNASGNQRMPDKDNFNCVIEKNAVHEIKPQYIVRRLTPTECARLQGFADCWGYIPEKDSLTDEELSFWLEVRNTHAAINGKAVKDYNAKQMLTWYNKLYTDSAEYKMWGNGIALPPALYCMQGMVDVLNASVSTGEDDRIAIPESVIEEQNSQNSEAVRKVMDFITEEPKAEPDPEDTEDDLTDLSDAPEEIKEEIMENAEKLAMINNTNEEAKMPEINTEPPAKNEEPAAAFNAVEQLKALAEERKLLAHINTNTPRFADDVRAIEYAVSVLEAMGM